LGILLVPHAGFEASRHDSHGRATARRDIVDRNSVGDCEEQGRSQGKSKKYGGDHGTLLDGLRLLSAKTIGGVHRRVSLCCRENLRHVSSDGWRDCGTQINRRAAFGYCT
jgi:hypothetical protein